MHNDTINPNSTNPSPRTAPPPFEKSIADIILRTSDRVDFHVFSQVLIAASPFFEGMFEVPQPLPDQEQMKYGKPIIEISEDSAAIETILRICYPINKPEKREVEEIEPALRAAMKYDMELPTAELTKDLKTLALDRPMTVWGVACRLRLETVALVAAQVLVRRNPRDYLLLPLNFEILGNMDGITAGDYYRLRDFYRCTGNVASEFKLLTPVVTSGFAAVVDCPRPVFSPEIPHPDLICRSSDGQEFPAHRAVLSSASPSLLETAGRLTSEHGDDMELNSSPVSRPILPFIEDGVVLSILLRICYHDTSDTLIPTDLPHSVQIVDALERYRLNVAHARAMSEWRTISKSSPLRAYCVAVQAGHTACAKEAARWVLQEPFEGSYVAEMEATPALAYHRLRTYYTSCQRVATERLAKTLSELSVPESDCEAEATEVPSQPPCESPVRASEVARKKKGKRGKWVGVMDPDFERTWISRYVSDSLQTVRMKGPRCTHPTLSQLFSLATGQGPEDRFWCSKCQPLAEDLIKADTEFRQLTEAMDAVELKI